MRFELEALEAGSGRPVVLLHPFPVDGRVFDGVLDAARDGRLAARIIAPDLPGFGVTPLPDPPPPILSVDDVATALERFVRDAGLDRPVLGGVAIGGYVALELAHRRPGLARGLVLMGCKAAGDAPQNRPMREATARQAREEGSRAVADALAGAPLGPGASDELRERMHAMIAAAEPEAIAALVMGLHERPDPTAALEAVEVPVLLLNGEADPFTKAADARHAATLLRDGTYVELPGVGHMAPLEAPDAVVDALAAFLERLP